MVEKYDESTLALYNREQMNSGIKSFFFVLGLSLILLRHLYLNFEFYFRPFYSMTFFL